MNNTVMVRDTYYTLLVVLNYYSHIKHVIVLNLVK